VFADLFLHQHIFWHTWWDQSINKINMATADLDTENVIAVTEVDLRDEQKQAMQRAMEEYKQLCLKSFSVNRSEEVIQKQELPMPRQVTFDPNPGKLQDMVDIATNRALINHSNVLSNTVYNDVARTFKEGQTPPLYAGPTYHQPGLSSVTAPSASPAIAGTKATSPPSTLGLTNGQSTSMRPNPTTSEGWVQLNTDLSASAMSGSVFQNCQIPPNWWGYGMPPEFFANSSRTSQVTNLAGKAPMTSAPLVSPMTQVPQYSTTTTARPITGNFQVPTFQMPNANLSANPLPTQQRFVTQTGYANPMITTNYQPSAGHMPMNANNGWTKQLFFPHVTQQNHQAAGFLQGQMQVAFQKKGPINQPMNLAQQIGGQQAMANMVFPGDRVPQRHVEAYQQVPEAQSAHR